MINTIMSKDIPKRYKYAKPQQLGSVIVDKVNNALRGLIAAEVGPAKGHMINGLPEMADAQSLKMWEALANTGHPYVSVNHSESVGSRVGYMTNARVVGDQLLCDVEFSPVAFIAATDEIGDYIMKAAENGDNTFFNLSFECAIQYQVINKQAFIRPTEVDGISLVLDGALVEKAFSTKKESNMTEDKKVETKDVVLKVETAPVVEKKLEEGTPDSQTTTVTKNPATGVVTKVKEDDVATDDGDPDGGADAAPQDDMMTKLGQLFDSKCKELSDLHDAKNKELQATLASLADAVKSFTEKKAEEPKKLSEVKPIVVVRNADIGAKPVEDKGLDMKRATTDTKYYNENKAAIWAEWKRTGWKGE